MKYLWILTVLLVSCSGSFQIPKPSRQAVPSTAEQKEKIERGIDLHDQGKFSQAVAVYEEVLAANPANVFAMYEIAYSLTRLGNTQASLDHAIHGLGYESPHASKLAILAGNNSDMLGKTEQAIKLYQYALTITPNDHMVHYNMGVTYFGQKNLEAAEASFLRSLELNPAHASTHIGLAEVYIDMGKQLEAIFLLTKFLILEPNTRRASTALGYLEKLMAAGVSQEGKGEVTVNLFGALGGESNYFTTAELAFKLTRSMRFTEDDGKISELDRRLKEFEMLFGAVNGDKVKTDGSFLEKYLLAYFSDLKDAGHTEACVYYIHQIADHKDIQKWLSENSVAIGHFKKWHRDYP